MDNVTLSQLPEWALLLMILALLWTAFWKAVALWHSARKGKSGWFIAISLVNTLGILEIIYLFGIEKVKTDKLFK
jgi:hypothetical protein